MDRETFNNWTGEDLRKNGGDWITVRRSNDGGEPKMTEMHEEDGRIVGLLPNDDGHGFEKVVVVALYIASGM